MNLPKGDPGVWLAKRLKPGDIVFDVGANEGQCAEHYIKAGAKVYCLEPDSRCWPGLLLRCPTVEILPCAAAAYAGRADLTKGLQTYHSSLRPQAVEKSVGRENVFMMRLDDLGVMPAAVKIDVQGCELDVLRGSTGLLKRCPLWVVEIWPHGFRDHVLTVEAIWTLMDSYGLYPKTLDEPYQPVSRTDLMDWCLAAEPNSFVNLAWM